jgi:acyl-CoA reductase-like NAD-dependent aldehyde dehydrogenase
MPGQIDIVDRLVKDAVAKGARLRTGGHRLPHGQFYAPTVLTDVDHSMAIMREETFGPVMCIMRVHSDEEVVRLANDSEYGLGSTIFTKDPERARRLGAELRAGSTSINDFGLCYMANALPFGGVRGSGFGRLNGREGIRACTNVKAVMEDRFPFLHIPAKLYPVAPEAFDRTKATLNLLYRRGVLAKLEALVELGRSAGRSLLAPRGRN